jgi:hypothetical protein
VIEKDIVQASCSQLPIHKVGVNIQQRDRAQFLEQFRLQAVIAHEHYSF